MKISGNGQSVSQDWTADDFDDEDGIGLVRAAGPLFVAGVALLGISTIMWGLWLLVGRFDIHEWATVGAGLAFVLLLLGLVFFPVGMEELFDGEDGVDITWGAGLILAAIGTASALVGTVLGLAVALRE